MRRLLPALALLVATACSGSSSTTPQGPHARTIAVFADQALKSAFESEKSSFEASHTGLTVQLQFLGAPDLIAQVRSGAAAGVVAGVGATIAATTSRLSGPPLAFAGDHLVLVGPQGRRLDPRHLSGLRIATEPPELPSAVAAKKLLPTLKPSPSTTAVQDVVTHRADAAIVWASETAGAAVSVVPLAGTAVDWAAGTVQGISAPDDADAFAGFLVSPLGRKILLSWGFTAH